MTAPVSAHLNDEVVAANVTLHFLSGEEVVLTTALVGGIVEALVGSMVEVLRTP